MKRLTNTHQMALRLYSLGQSPSKIAEQVPLSANRIQQLTREPLGVEYLKSLEGYLDDQFKGLYAKVVKVIGDAMDCADASVALAGANLWMKAHGKFVHKVEHRDLTAEDIIAKIIAGELVVPGKEPKLVGEGLGRSYEEAEFSIGPSLQ
jgi:hypothetical protein